MDAQISYKKEANSCSQWQGINTEVCKSRSTARISTGSTIVFNDMEKNIKSPHYYFADDTQLFQAKTSESIQIYKLNMDLKEILSWSKKWMVEFAPEKTIHIRIAKSKPPSNQNYQTYGTKSQITFNQLITHQFLDPHRIVS